MFLAAIPPSEPLPPGPSRVRVLVVEDDPPTSHALRMLLRHYKYDVTVAATVAAALSSLAEKPDVVLLDLMLPDGDGVTVLQAIRDQNLHAQVTVVTGVGDPQRIDHVRRLKPNVMLQKPVDFLQILNALPPLS